MLKTNLIAIAIITLGLGITSALGQAADWEIKPAVKTPKTTIKNPKQVQPGQNSGGTITNQRTKQPSQDKLGNFEIQGIKSPRDVATGQIKSPRDVATGQATGKRQHKPVKGYNLGDTGTHEVGH